MNKAKKIYKTAFKNVLIKTFKFAGWKLYVSIKAFDFLWFFFIKPLLKTNELKKKCKTRSIVSVNKLKKVKKDLKNKSLYQSLKDNWETKNEKKD